MPYRPCCGARALPWIVAFTLAAASGAQSTKLSGPTIAAGDVRAFRWSADGAWLAYVADAQQDEVDELFSVALLAGNAVTKLNPPLVAGGDVASAEGRLEISADGQWALYLADQEVDERRELYRVALDGTIAAVKLSHALSGNARLEDFQRAGTDWIVYRALRSGLAVDDLYGVPLDGSQAAVQLTGASVLLDEYRVTPDGARVVVRVNNRLFSSLVGSGPLNLLSAAGAPPARFLFSASGQEVLFDNPGTSLSWERQRLFSRRVDGSDQVVLVLAGHPTDEADLVRFAVSSDSRRLVYLWDRDVLGRYDLYTFGGSREWTGIFDNDIVSATGTPVRGRPVLLATGVGDGLVDGVSFEVGPDGRRVAFLDGVGTDPELFSALVALPGPVLQLTSDVAVLQAIAFSPDSTRIVYLAELEGAPGISRLFSVPADGSASPVELNGALVPGGEVDASTLARPFQITPDGGHVVYRADQDQDEVFELYARALDGSGGSVRLNGALVAGGDVGGSSGTVVVPPFRIAPDSSAVVYAADQDQDEVFELYASPLP